MTDNSNKIRPGSSLKFRLWLMLTAVFLLTYASVSVIVLYGVDQYLQNSTETGLHILASERLRRIEAQLSHQVTDLRAWSRLEVMNDLVARDVDQRIATTLSQMKTQYRLPGNIYAFDATGRLVATAAGHPARDVRMPTAWRNALARHAIFLDKHTNPLDGRLCIAFLMPVHATFTPGKIIGSLVLTYPWRAVVSQLHTDDASFVLWVDRPTTKVLYNGVGKQTLTGLIPDLTRFKSRLGPHTSFLAAYARVSRNTHAGHHSITAPLFAPDNWVVSAIEAARSQWLAPLAIAWRWIVLSSLLIGLPIGIFIFRVSRSFVRPITDLTATAVAISDSADLPKHAVEVRSRDELGLLQRSFNRMLLRLHEAFREQRSTASKLEQLNRTLKTMALTDSLTGLPNRRAAETRLIEERARAKRLNTGFALALCDLDNFKLVNDRFGHQIGDQLLHHTTEILREVVRSNDWVARWGGEEFLLFLDQVDATEALEVAERARAAVKAAPLQIEQTTITITASFGISVLTSGETDISDLLTEADERLYAAKKAGRDSIVGPQRPVTRILKQAADLQLALQEERVVPAYQVIIDLRTNTVVANEALARLVLPDGKVVAAAQFIEAAEDTNLVHQVDQTISMQAISRCCDQLCREQQRPIAHFINLSPHYLSHQGLVGALLDHARVCCDCSGEQCMEGFGVRTPVVVEVTERQRITDFKDLRKKLQPLVDFGIRLALDDFGSGYSSFLYLIELPVSFLKIEGWMIQNVRKNPEVRHAVESIVEMARKLNITTIGECVEDAETARLLRELGVDWAQGYYFGKPECAPSLAVVPRSKTEYGM